MSVQKLRLTHEGWLESPKLYADGGYLIGSAVDIDNNWFEDSVETVGVSAGASTPDFLVEDVIDYLMDMTGGKAEIVLPEKNNRIRRSSRPVN